MIYDENSLHRKKGALDEGKQIYCRCLRNEIMTPEQQLLREAGRSRLTGDEMQNDVSPTFRWGQYYKTS